MKELISSGKDILISVKGSGECDIRTPRRYHNYSILLISAGEGIYHADFGAWSFKAPVLLFSTPLQQIYIEEKEAATCNLMQFHGDFYCIEYHKAQVACNGLLFNNIYIQPSVDLTKKQAAVFARLFKDIEDEFSDPAPSDIVLRSYLQLFLAKAASAKMRSMQDPGPAKEADPQMQEFIRLLENNYLTLHKPADYAKLLNMSPNNFNKRAQKYFSKSPSALIHERIILEAKKQLHLTRKTIKEIAYALNFEDEFYFSRRFKQFTKVSPQAFRDATGISIVANQPS